MMTAQDAGAGEKDGPRFDCDMCQFAFECGGPRAWHCDACGSSHDLREGAQLSMIRDDQSLNQAIVE